MIRNAYNRFKAWARAELHPGAMGVLVILLTLVLQNMLMTDMASMHLVRFSPYFYLRDEIDRQWWNVIRLVVFLPVVIFWVFNLRRWLNRAIVLSNALLTLELVVSVLFLLLTLRVQDANVAWNMMRNTVLIMLINALTFSLWYWLIDAPRLRAGTPRENEPIDFLFPQRGSPVKGYESWVPGYFDYFFLAVITATTFGPADTLPLSQRAKLFMAFEVILSFLTISVLAARALGVLTN